MAKSSTIIIEILEFLCREGGAPKTWHIDVSKDTGQRFLDEHQAVSRSDARMSRVAASEGEALKIQSYFLELGLAESEEDWQPGARIVSVYRKHGEPIPNPRQGTARACIVGRRLRQGPAVSAWG
jgi:hypothetical protein